MAHIGFIIPRFHTNMVGWVEQLEAAGHLVSLLVTRTEPTESKHPRVSILKSRFCYPKLEGKKLGPNAESRKSSISDWLDDFMPDLLIVRDYNTLYSQIALFLALLRGVRTIIYLQIKSLKDLHPLHAGAIKIFCRVTSARIMTPVPLARNEQNSPNITFTPFVPRAAFFTPTGPTETDTARLRMISVGKFVHRKRHDAAINCFQIKGLSDATLTIVGEASCAEHKFINDEIFQQIQSQQLSNRVKVMTNVHPESMPVLFRNHDLLLMLAENEPASITVLEALASGLVVVVRADNLTSAFVRDSGFGSVIPAVGEQCLERAIQDALEILQNTSRIERQSEFRAIFGPSAAINSWCHLISDE